MKLALLFLVFVGVCYTQTGPFTNMPPADYNNNVLITTLRDIGVQAVLTRALNGGRITDTNFVIQSVNSVGNQTTARYWFYRFNISLTNVNNDRLTAIFVMRHTIATGAQLLSSSSFSIAYGTRPGTGTGTGTGAAAYVPVPAAEWTTPLIQRMATAGRDRIVNVAVTSGRIPAGNYAVSAINSVDRQPLATGANYQFNVNITKDDNTRQLNANFRINYRTATNAVTVSAYGYSVLPFSTA